MDNKTLYQERIDLIKKTIALEPVDHVPVIFMGTAFTARYNNISIADYCRDPKLSYQANILTMDRIGGFDGANLAGGGRITAVESVLWMSKILVPGKDLPADSLWQVQEAETMKVEEYDDILKMGWNKYVQSYLPRVINKNEFIMAMMWNAFNAKKIFKAYQKKAYPVVSEVFIQGGVPFEALCGARSMSKFIVDLFRIPDKVEAVMQIMLEETLEGIKKVKVSKEGIGGAWLGGWRTASGLLSPKLWDRFVWPYILKIVDAMLNAGITPVLHWDQDWTRDLGRLVELPAKKCILNPDGMTDMKKFKAVAGDRMAMMGDVPASLLAAGTPEEVRIYVRDLIELFEGKGLMICPGCDAPISTKPENMKAMVEAAHEFGTFSR